MKLLLSTFNYNFKEICAMKMTSPYFCSEIKRNIKPFKLLQITESCRDIFQNASMDSLEADLI